MARKTLFCDATKQLPFKTSTVSAFYLEHIFEHINFEEGCAFLTECKRCLVPGGVIRIAVPDAGRYISSYEGPWDKIANIRPLEKLDNGWKDCWLQDVYQTQMQFINAVFRQNDEHKYAYDEETLKLAFQKGGFHKIRVANANDSVHPAMLADSVDRIPESLYVEGIA